MRNARLRQTSLCALRINSTGIDKIFKSNLHYTRAITPQRIISGGAHIRDFSPGQHSSEKISQRWQTSRTSRYVLNN